MYRLLDSLSSELPLSWHIYLEHVRRCNTSPSDKDREVPWQRLVFSPGTPASRLCSRVLAWVIRCSCSLTNVPKFAELEAILSEIVKVHICRRETAKHLNWVSREVTLYNSRSIFHCPFFAALISKWTSAVLEPAPTMARPIIASSSESAAPIAHGKRCGEPWFGDPGKLQTERYLKATR